MNEPKQKIKNVLVDSSDESDKLSQKSEWNYYLIYRAMEPIKDFYESREEIQTHFKNNSKYFDENL